jgi:hypothetical protein
MRVMVIPGRGSMVKARAQVNRVSRNRGRPRTFTTRKLNEELREYTVRAAAAQRAAFFTIFIPAAPQFLPWSPPPLHR